MELSPLSEADSGEYALRCETSSQIRRSVPVLLRVVKSENLCPITTER